MSLKSTRVFVAITALVSLVSISGHAQDVKSKVAQWRTSFDAFVKAIDEFPVGEVPFSTAEGTDLTGQRVSGDAAVMKRFGGTVEFEGVFQGIVTSSSPSAPQKRREKIDISMALPAGISPNTSWTLHLYPKAGSLKAWRALAPKTPIKFRAVVTGITMSHTFITGVDLRAYSILLEDGEVVRNRPSGGGRPRQ